VVRVAGGFVVTAMAWQLLREGDNPQERNADSGVNNQKAIEDEAFYPLTMPLTVGPGSIATAITLGSQRPAGGDFLFVTALGAAAIVGLLAIAVTIYVSYRFAENIEKILGRSGTNVLVRLSAFILLCIGVQIMWSGYIALAAQTTH
jgi:multiple antibiotic resistance protein